MSQNHKENTVMFRHEFYYKENDQWFQKSTACKLAKSEVPEQVIKMLEESKKDKEVDISEFVENEFRDSKKNLQET